MELAGKKGEVKIFTTPWCPYCIRAKQLLKKKKVPFEDTNVAFKGNLRTQLQSITGSHTVPQIFIHGESIGGCDELFALDSAGKLDGLLAGVAAVS